MMSKRILILPLLFLAGNLAGQTVYTENTVGQFSAGSHNSTYVTGSAVALDHYGRAAGLDAPGGDEWFNGSWDYRRPLTINSANPAGLAGYAVAVTVNTQAAIAAGRMKADGSDIRFTTAAVAGLAPSLPYYIESGLNTVSTKIWVKHPLVSSGSNPLYLYSGNAAAAAASSLPGTFVMGDNFNAANGSAPSSSTWVTTESGAPAGGSLRDIQANRLRMLFGSPLGNRYYGLRSANQYSFAAGRRYRAEINARASGDSWSSFTLCQAVYTYAYDQDDWLRVAVHHTASGPSYSIERSDYGTKTTLTSGALSAGLHAVDFLITASSFSVLLDGSEVYAAANTLPFNSPYLYLEAAAAGASLEEFVFDNVTAQPYSYPEPAFGSAGAEQGRRYAAGSFLSQTYDSGAAGSLYSRADWADAVPAGSSVTLQARAHDTDVALGTFTAVAKGGNPAVYGRYAQYRLNFSTLDPRYTAAVSSVTLVYGSPPLAPAAPAGLAQSESSIRWTWTDNSSGQYQEEGFKVFDASGVLKGSVGPNSAEWTESGLNPNTLYARAVAGYNQAGTGPSSPLSRYTLPVAPNVGCDRSTGTWLSGTLTCNNLAGFGTNGVAYYRYQWTQSPSYTWGGSEPQWTSGSMAKSDFSTGNYYLHVKAYNGNDVSLPGYQTYGPYWYDRNVPAVTGFSPSSGPWTNTGLNSQGSYGDTGGSKLNRVRYRWTTSADRPATGWQAWDSAIAGNDTASSNFTIGSPGQWYLHVEVEDTAGNVGYGYTGVFRIDTTKPAGSIMINGGADYTASRNVSLGLTYSDSESGVKNLAYRNLGGTESQPELPQATTAWTLAAGDGSKQVYVKVTDNAGNVQQYADTITLDSRTSLLGYGIGGTASGVMGETADSFQARAAISWTADGSPLEGKTVFFHFRGSTKTALTDSLGAAATGFYVPAATGTYVYNIWFETDGTYSASSSTGTLLASQRGTTLVTEDVNATSGAAFTAKATLKDFNTELPINGATVSFYFEGSTLTAVTNAIGVATVTFTAPLAVNFYDYNATYSGGAVYAPKTASSRVGVGLRVTSLAVPAAASLAQAEFNAQATLMDGVIPVEGATVSFYFQGSTQTALTDATGLAVYAFTAPASSGTYPFSASFAGDGTYAASSGGALLTVNRRPLSLAGEMGQGYVDASFQARAVLYDGVTAQRVPGKTIVFIFESSSATVVTDAMGVSTAVFAAGALPRSATCYYYFAGDSGYAFADSTAPVTIERRPVALSASDTSALIGSSFTAVAELKDTAFTPVPVAGKTVTFNFLGEQKTAVTDAMGVASATYSSGMSTGTYEYYASFAQDASYLADNDTGTVTMDKRPVVVSAYPRFVFAFDSIQGVADLKDGVTGEYISSQTISFNYNGVAQSTTTGYEGASLGRAYAVYPGTGVAGTYSYSATFPGTALYSANSSTGSITVTKRSVNLTAFPQSAIWGSSFTATAEFRDGATNTLVGGKQLRLAFSTAPASFQLTSGAGVASSTFTAPASTGAFSWFANFAGDAAYAAAASTGTVSVNRRAPTVTPVASSKYVWDSIYLSATFADEGNPVPGRLLSFYFNGSTLTATTNAGGVATTVAFSSVSAQGVYGFTVQFNGDTNYSAQSGSSTVTVSRRPSNLNLGPISAIASSSVTLSATLIDTNWTTPVSGKSVSFTLQGATHTLSAVTNASGIASVIYQSSGVTGPYTYSATFAGNTNYSGTSSSETLTVTRRPAVLEMADYYPPASSTFTASAVLKDFTNGNAIASKTVSFLFLGSTRTGVTTALGYAATSYVTLSSTMSYPIEATYAGDTLYAPATIVKTVFPGRRNTAIQTSDILTAVAKDTFTVTGRLSDYDQGTYISGATLTFSFTGSTYTLTAVTNSTGIASVQFGAPTATGTYSYTATYAGSALYNGTLETSSVLVNRRTPALNPSDLTGVPAISTFTASAVLSDGALTLSTKTLSFVFVSTKSAATNGIGVATTSFIAPVSTGTFSYKVTFAGDALYNPATAYATLGVVLKPTVLEVLDVPDAVVGLKFTGTAKLRDIEAGNALVLSTKTITITFRPYAVTYTSAAVTAAGVSTAAFVAPLSTGTYAYTAAFAGDGIYGASNSSGTVTVNRRPVLFSLASDPVSPYAYRANAVNSSFTVTGTLSDGQVAGLNLAGQSLTFVFQNSTKTAVTDALGVASVIFPSPASSGTYSYFGYFYGDNSYNPNRPEDSEKSINIVQRPTNILPRDSLSGLLNVDGSPNPYYTFWKIGVQSRVIDTLSGQGVLGVTANFVLNGSTITGVTDAIGTAVSSSPFPGVTNYGVYPAVVRFYGNGTYGPSVLPGSTNLADPYTAKIRIHQSPAGFDVPQITETYPDADTVLSGNVLDWWNRPVSYADRIDGNPNAALVGYPVTYQVSTIPCGADCAAVGRNWAITGTGFVNATNVATATVRSPLAAGDYPIQYWFNATNSFTQWGLGGAQRVLRVGRRLTYIIPDSEPFTVGAQMPISLTVKLADLTQSLAGVNGKNLDVVLVTTQTLVTGSAGPAGKVKATFAGMSVGTYTYIARFADGDPAYMPYSSSGTVVVEKNTTGLAADNVSNIPAGNTFDARATLTIVQGTTTLPLAGKTINFVFTSTNGPVNMSAVTNGIGVATVTYYSPYVPANYNYTADFPEDSDNKPSSDLTNTVQVVKRRTQVAAQNAAVYIQENFISTATLTDLDLGGAAIPGVTISYVLHKTPDISATAPTNASGVAVASFLSPDAANTYQYSATFPGTSIYAVSSDTKTVTVSRRVTSLNAADVTTPTNSSFTITTSLSDVTHDLGVSTPIAGVQVKFVFNGETKYAATDAYGVVSATFTAPAVSANYPYTVYFEGNQTFNVTNTPRTVIVRKRNTTVSGTDVVAPAGSAFTAQALLIDEFGQKLENYTITFVFTGTGTFTGTDLTDANGLATKVYVSPLSTGTYNYTASFAGDDTYAANADNANEVLVNVASTTLSVPDGTVTVNMLYTATATLKGASSGAGVPNKPVDFTFNGVNLGQVVTDENGVAIKTFTPASTGTFRLDVNFYGDTAFFASSSSSTITVTRRLSGVAVPNVLTEVEAVFIATATLRDYSAVPSVPIAGRTVEFLFEGSPKTAVTNALGIATVPYNAPLFSGTYSLSANFPGDLIFTSSAALAAVNVAKHEITIAVANGSIPALEVFNATATLTLGVTPVPGKTIQFLYKGQPLSAVTDAAGQAFVQYYSGASSGPWRVDANFDGSADPTYASTATYGTITVLRRTCVVVPENISLSVFDAFTATATFRDVVSSSTPAGKYAKVAFNWIKATTFTATATDGSGLLYVSTGAPVSSGTYKVEAYYTGDATYAPSLASTATVTVTRRPSQLGMTDVAIMFGRVFTATATLRNEALPLVSKPVTFTFEGRTFTKMTIAGGVATATFTVTQSTGPSQIDAVFNGDAAYGGSNVATATVTAVMRPTAVTPAAATAIADKIFVATATLKDIDNLNVAGKQVDFVFDGETLTGVTNALGVATAAFTADVATGTYGIGVYFNGTYAYVASSSTLSLTVQRRPTSMIPLGGVTARALDVFYGTATLRDLDSLNLGAKPVRFLFQGATFYRTTDGSGVGISTWAAPASSGTYTLGAYFDGDEKYAPSTAAITVTNLPRPVGIALNGVAAVAQDLFKTTATLTDLNNGLLTVSTRSVSFSFSWGASTAALTNGVGVATAAYNATATAGTYQLTGSFAGDATYASTSTVVPLVVAKRGAYVTGVYVSTRVFDVFTASGTFYDSVSSAPVAGRTMKFILQHGSTFTAVTNGAGVAAVNFTAHGSSGTYAIYTMFEGDATYNPAVTYVSSVTLARRDSRITLTAPASVIINSTFTAAGTMYDSVSNAAAPSKMLSFLFQGSTVPVFANGSGYAGTGYTASLSSGSYALQVSFAGDASYNPSVSTRTVTSLRYPALIAGPGVTVTMNEVFTATATLTDYLASTVPAKALTFSFQALPFVDVTDALGVAYSTYAAVAAAGSYQLPVTFAGDALYDSTSTNIPVLVNKRVPLLAVSTVSVRALDVFTASATLADNLYPAQKLSGQTVSFEFVVGTTTFTGSAVTDAQGLAVRPFTAPASTGTYQLRGNFAGNGTYYSSIKTSTVTVTARPALLSLADSATEIDELFRTTATLTDQDTLQPVAARLLTFTFGASSGAYTAADGLASVRYGAPSSSGAYRLDVAFAGDATYGAITSSATLTVKRRPLALAAPDIAGIIDEVFKATVTVTDALSAAAVTGRSVNFVFSGSTFAVQTAAGGVAISTFAAPSATGLYYAAVNFPGDARYLPAATTAQLTVDRRPAAIIADPLTARAAQVFTATASLRDVLAPGYKPAGRPLVFFFQGSSFTALTDADGLAVSTFMAPSSSGAVRLDISFAGDARYAAAASSAAVSVLRRLSLLTIEPISVSALDVFTATATLTDKVDTGAYAPGRDVIFHFAGTSVTAVTDAGGIASASFSAPLSSGTYQVAATFEGDSVYDTSYSSGAVAVLQRPVGIAIADGSAYPYEQFTATGTLTDGATAAPVAGRLLLFGLDGTQLAGTTDGVGVATAAYTPPGTFGDYELSADFAGDATYAAWSATGTVSVMQRPTAVAAPDAAATAMDVFIASAALSDVRFGTPVEGKEMIFLFEGQTSSAATDAQGLAWTQFAAPVSSGTFFFTAEFHGDPVYAVSSATGAVAVSTRFTRTIARDTNANVGEPFVLSATLTDPAREGQPGYFVPNAAMKFIFKDRDNFTIEEGSATTNSVGVATVTFSGPGSPDVYYYTAVFEGNYSYTPSSATAMVKVGLLTSLVAFDVETEALENFKVKAKLTDYLSTTLDDKAVRFTFLGLDGAGMTNAEGDSGVASSTFTAPPSSGTYYYNAYFDGDPIYSASNATATITVKLRTASIVTYPTNAVSYSSFTALIALKDLKSNAAIGGRDVEIYFNGSTVAANTDADTGVAGATFFAPYSSGTYNYYASFAGDDTYAPSVGTGTLSVSLRPTNMLSYNVTDLTSNSTFTARVQIKDNSNLPVEGLSVDFNFEGQFGIGVTDALGLAEVVLTAPASSGTYTYSAVFYGDERYAASNADGTVAVGPRPTLMVTSAVSSKLGSPLGLSARLVDTATQAGISGKLLSFYFSGATLTAATDSFGISSVAFASPASTGAYYYEAQYAGDGLTYMGSYSSSPVTIALNFTQLEAAENISIKIYEPLPVQATLRDSIGVQMPGMPVTFTFEAATSEDYTDEIGRSTASFPTLLLASTGTYNYTAEFAGDTLYVAASDTANVVNVGRRDSLLTAGSLMTTPGKPFTAAALLSDNVNDSVFNGSPVSGRTILFEFFDSSYTQVSSGTTSALGVSSAPFTAPASTGTFLLTARFADSDPIYAGAFSSAAVVVMLDDGTGAIKTKLTLAHAQSYLSRVFTASGTLTATDEPVPGKAVLFEFFNGVATYTAAGYTDGVGLATAAFTAPASSGTYNMTASFAGDAEFSAASGTATLTALRYPVTLTAQDVSAYAGEQFRARAVLRDDLTLAYVAAKTVTFNFFDGASTITLTAVTSSTGSAEVDFTAPSVPGDYFYTASFAGDTVYNAAADTASLLIASRGSSTFLVGYDTGYDVSVGTGEVVAASATLTSKGYPVPGKAVTITFQGVARISTTNAQGLAFSTFTTQASSGTFVYQAEFTGDANYNATSATAAVLVVFRKQPEPPAFKAEVTSTTVTLAWTAVTQYQNEVKEYIVEQAVSLRGNASTSTAVSASSTAFTCDVDPDESTFIKIKTKLNDEQVSATTLIVEVPSKAEDPARVPNYYYMSPGENPQDWAAWVKIPGKVMDKVSANNAFDISVEKDVNPDFLAAYTVKPTGAQSATLEKDLRAADRKGVKLTIAYPKAGTGTSAAGQVALYWYNGVEWVKLGGEIDVLTGEIYTYSRVLGQFAVRAATLASEFTLTKVAPRIFTPDAPDATPGKTISRATFYFENPAGGEVTIRIFDITGALVRRNLESAGASMMFWDGRDQAGTLVKGGAYIYQVEAGEEVITGTVVVAK